ncbi:MAG: rhodanese-like domain-containing protein, partial [Caldilineaceae bacterium]|nr:rhodanese-like domain-containing protein [Caldilineaceae bacterium]
MNLFAQLFGGAVGNGHNLSAAEYKSRYVQTNTAHLLIDVRSPAEFAEGHITGAKNMPLQELPQRLAQIPHDKPVMLYCRSGNRSGMAL